MRKIIVLACLCINSIFCFSQTCEERETKLIHGLTSFSAGLLYNTYAVIGSLSDGFGNDVYDAKSMTSLLNAQKQLLDNLSEVLRNMTGQQTLRAQRDIDFANSSASILKGLKTQADLMLSYVRSKTPQRLEAYETQRNKNWNDITSLMGLKE
jgi:hypothetical protein